MFDSFRKAIIQRREDDELLYEYVLTEIENKVIVKGLWAKAMALSDGNKDKTQSLYMQYRVQAIKDLFTKLEISYNDLKKDVLFKKISMLFSGTESQTEKTINIDESTKYKDSLNESGYLVENSSDQKGWIIHEPLGGKAHIYTIEELEEYANSKFHNRKKPVKLVEVPRLTESFEECAKYLSYKGYEVKENIFSDGWTIIEPLGGKIKIKHFSELQEFTTSK